MTGTVSEQLIESHLVNGSMQAGQEVKVRIDQTLTQDATGTLVMLALEALGLGEAQTDVSAQYVDHNLLQEDAKNPDDHVFLRSACRRFGLWFSGPGNGVSHPVHMQRFGAPGRTMVGSDSHTCAAGSLGMLAIGAGGLDVAMAIAGEPFTLSMPQIWGIRLTGELRPWVSAKDVILEMLRRHGVEGGSGRIIEYYGPGVAQLSAMDRHVIANMGAELGATTTVFPADERTREFLAAEGRESDFQQLSCHSNATFDVEDEIDLGSLVPLIAKPTSPGNVVPVEEVAGRPIYQAYVGSSANPGHRDFAVAADMVKGRQIAAGVSFDINPTSRQLLTQLTRDGRLESLIRAGARIHQAGCNGCIGMGQAPAFGKNSVRTVPRNFPGRSGTREDSVYLASPETATASALRGCLADPRSVADDLDLQWPTIEAPKRDLLAPGLLEAPPTNGPSKAAERDEMFPLEKGSNVGEMPRLPELPNELEVEVVLCVGDDVSTDEILPAGAKVLPYRSNIEKISEFCFAPVDEQYVSRAKAARDHGGHAIVGGRNYGQGSSREHAALAPRTLGLRLVLARSFARIHRDNLVNFGVLPVEIESDEDAARLELGTRVVVRGLHQAVSESHLEVLSNDTSIRARVALSDHQRSVLRAGGLVNWWRNKRAGV